MSTRYLWAWTLVLALFGCGGKTPTEFLDPKPEAKIDASPKLVLLGETVNLSMVIRGVTCTPSWREGTISSGNISESYVPQATGVFDFTINCAGSGGTVSATTQVQVVRRTISGKVFGLKEGPVWTGNWKAVVSYGSVRDSVSVSPDGSFSIEVDADNVDLIVDDKDIINRRFFPTLIALKRAQFGNISVLKIPVERTISNGIYSGQKIVQSLELAYTRIPNNLSFYPRDSLAVEWLYHIKYFPRGSSPILTAFDHAESTDPISSADSIGFWSAVDSVESAYGEDLFKPANVSDLPTGKGLRLWVDRNMTSTASAGSNVDLLGQVEKIVGGIFRVIEPGVFSLPFATQHELTHVLGFGHTCVWSTVMFSGFLNECGQEWKSLTLTAYDVAYKELMYAVAERMLETGAKYGLAEAHQGERVLMLGLPRQVIWYPNQ